MDWKGKVDRHQAEISQREAEERQRVIDNQLREQHERDRKAQEEEARGLERLANKFRCHICNTPSKVPARHRHYDSTLSNGEWMPSGGYVDDGPDYGKPADLQKCTRCGRWTCSEHFYQGFCQRCAENL